MKLQRRISVAIAYEHAQIPRDCWPALLTRSGFGVRWWPLYWFPRDVWPWWEPDRRKGRLSA